jgi:hypothetical protein
VADFSLVSSISPAVRPLLRHRAALEVRSAPKLITAVASNEWGKKVRWMLGFGSCQPLWRCCWTSGSAVPSGDVCSNYTKSNFMSDAMEDAPGTSRARR